MADIVTLPEQRQRFMERPLAPLEYRARIEVFNDDGTAVTPATVTADLSDGMASGLVLVRVEDGRAAWVRRGACWRRD